MSKPTMTVTKDFTDNFNDTIEQFKNDMVLVGIPESDTGRNDNEAGEQITNAALLAINQFGSPANNIPARPVMTIGIRNAQAEIAKQFIVLAQSVLQSIVKKTSSASAFTTYYNRIGIIASSSIKKAINDQDGIAGPSEATLASRKAQGFSGTKALIVTGQMRNAITYVVRGGK